MTGRVLLAGVVGFILRGAVVSTVLWYVRRRDRACPECGRPLPSGHA